MIDLHYWPTPNGWKVTILLEETGLPYRIVPVNIGRGEQFAPEFLRISPNNRMPAIVDHEPADGGAPVSVFESGAILIYLAEKTCCFLPRGPRERAEVLQWLMWQMGGLGPMLGQANHFLNYAPEKLHYAIARYTDEANRLFGVLDGRLADREFVAGEYSIADMASWPWVVAGKRVQPLDEFPHLRRWHDAVGARPAAQRGLAVGKELRDAARAQGGLDEEARRVLFGQRARRSEAPRERSA